MFLKRSFILFGVLFFLTEPFIVHAVPLFGNKPVQVCPSCGMKDMCGPVCCCVGEHSCDAPSPMGETAFRAGGCVPDRPTLAPTFSDLAKLLPGAGCLTFFRDAVPARPGPRPGYTGPDLAPASPPPEFSTQA